MATFKLLTLNNPKTAKGEAYGYLTAMLHLAPANVAGHGTVCASASPGSMAACLNTAGRGGIVRHGASTNVIQEARKRRTAFYKLHPEGFENALAVEIQAARGLAKRHGLKLAVRINGTSDLPMLAVRMANRFPSVQFYDYTKHMAGDAKRIRPNYHLTLSRSETRPWSDYAMALKNGVNVAVVFDTQRNRTLPGTWQGIPVVDGDLTDLRFLDPKGVIVGLRAKGRAKRDTTGFVVRLEV